MRTLIKNGTVVSAAESYRADVLIEDDKIDRVGRDLTAEVDVLIDAHDRLVIPGGIDVHVHLDLPFGGTRSSDDFASGTVAAAFGGTTTILDFAVQDRGEPLRKGWEVWMAKAEGKAVIDYGFHMIMREYSDALGHEMSEMMREGVTSFKVFTAYPGVFLMNDANMFRVMQRAGEIGATMCVHAESGEVIDFLVKRAVAEGKREPKYHALTRPARAEAEATHRALAFAEMAGAPLYVVHLTAAEALDEVRAARARGVAAYAETCPQYLFLSDENYEECGFNGAKYVMSPPLRSRQRQEELWQGLANNDLQVVSTDHCPFFMEGQKDLGKDDFTKIPNGAPGIETRMSLMYDGGVRQGRFSVNRWVEITSTAPAKMFGMYPKKGSLAPGADADIVIFNPEAEQVLSVESCHMNVDYNPYEGRRVAGVTETVLSRGEVIVDQGRMHGRGGRGRYLKRGESML